MLTRWDPFRERLSLRNMLDRWFEDSLTRSLAAWPERTEFEIGFPLDVYETDDELIIQAELPGVKPENVDINVSENTLAISGEFREEEERQRGNFHLQERRYGSFRRTIGLPANVNIDVADASFENGVLKVKIPKREGAKQKKISVKKEE